MSTLILYFTLFSSSILPTGPMAPELYDQISLPVYDEQLCNLIAQGLLQRKWIYMSIGDKKYRLVIRDYECKK